MSISILNNQKRKWQNVKCIILYFQDKEMKVQGLNNSLMYRPYCKKNETIQAGYQEANTQTKMQGKPMKNMMRIKTTQKFNHKKVYYHSASTQQLGQRPKKTQQS